MRSVCELGARDFRPCLDFFLITPHSIFVTHHSSLKIPNFSIPTHLAHFTHLLITQFYYFFVRPIPIKWSNPSVNKISFNQKTKIVTTTTTIVTTPISPKTQTRTHKNFRSSLASLGPSLVNNTHLSDVYVDRMGWVFFENSWFFCVWMHMFMGLCLCVREKIMRSEERKKEQEERKK